jgi:hypothetical protein
MKIIFLTFFSLSVFAQNIPQCPPESFVVEFNSPITKAKKSFCAYQKNGETIKHGEELIFDTKDEVVKRILYNHGQEGESPTTAVAPDFKGANIPGTEEASGKFTDTLIGTKPLSDEQKFLSTVQDLMAVLTMKKENSGKGLFKVSQCDDKPMDWLKAAIFNTQINKSYVFKDLCDVKGTFSANFTSEFPMKFELRNLQDFNKTEMTLKMKVTKSASGIRYAFEVVEGFISSPTRNANFKVEYEIDINPLTGVADKSSQKGKVTLTKIDNKEVKDVSAPWKYEN